MKMLILIVFFVLVFLKLVSNPLDWMALTFVFPLELFWLFLFFGTWLEFGVGLILMPFLLFLIIQFAIFLCLLQGFVNESHEQLHDIEDAFVMRCYNIFSFDLQKVIFNDILLR